MNDKLGNFFFTINHFAYYPLPITHYHFPKSNLPDESRQFS
jgi:hypothetical protein